LKSGHCLPAVVGNTKAAPLLLLSGPLLLPHLSCCSFPTRSDFDALHSRRHPIIALARLFLIHLPLVVEGTVLDPSFIASHKTCVRLPLFTLSPIIPSPPRPISMLWTCRLQRLHQLSSSMPRNSCPRHTRHVTFSRVSLLPLLFVRPRKKTSPNRRDQL
jgi:hypothetical protein